jgi:glycosyltransferase involved in cell wall biosynthesis
MTETVVFGMCTKDEMGAIRETMRAIRMQTRTPDYIYICDDSDDTTVEIIRDELKQSNIPFKVFEQEHYDGHGGARQELYEHVQRMNPNIFCLLDANNTVDDRWLENLLGFWDDHPEYDVLTGPNCSEDVHREVLSPHDPLYYRHANISLDMDFLDAIGGWDPNFGRGEDWDLALRMYRADAKVFTSSRWCSCYLNSEPSGIARKRIARNPTSVPFLTKYGCWYAIFHPSQLLKDIGSVLFYLLVGAVVVAVTLAPQYGLLLGGLTVFYTICYILGGVLYTKETDFKGIIRAMYRLYYTAPAIFRKTREVLHGRYRNT